MTTPQTIEQHAESILQAAGLECPFFDEGEFPPVMRQAILTALTAYGVACAAAMREAAADCCNKRGIDEEEEWGLTRAAQNYYRARNAVRQIEPSAVIKGMGHG